METPQVFKTSMILDAYEKIMARDELVTDEVSALQKLGKTVALFRDDDWNPKITFPRDLELAGQILAVRRANRES